MSRLLGIALLLLGIYFLGQNIIFATHYSPYVWRDIPAAGSVLAIMGGIISLLFFPRQTDGKLWLDIIGNWCCLSIFEWRCYLEAH